MTADHLDYIRAIVRHRVPEASDDDIAMLATQPDDNDALPIPVVAKITEVLDLLEDRLESLAARQSLPPPETMVDLFRQAMIDMTVQEKAAVVDQLNGWVEAEKGTGEPLQ